MCNSEVNVNVDVTLQDMDRCKSLFESVCELGFVSKTTLYFLCENKLVDAFNAHCDLSDKPEFTINVNFLHD